MASVVISTDGQVKFLDKPEMGFLKKLGNFRRWRASNIEPVDESLRQRFYRIRNKYGDMGEVSTRSWSCNWRVNLQLSGGPVFGDFSSRDEAISAEEKWLLDNGFPDSVDN